jgi:hypothetical protein
MEEIGQFDAMNPADDGKIVVIDERVDLTCSNLVLIEFTYAPLD